MRFEIKDQRDYLKTFAQSEEREREQKLNTLIRPTPTTSLNLFNRTLSDEEKEQFIQNIMEQTDRMLANYFKIPSLPEEAPKFLKTDLRLITPANRKEFLQLKRSIRKQKIKAERMGIDIPDLEERDTPFFFKVLNFLRKPEFVATSIIYDMQNGDFNPVHLAQGVVKALTGEREIEGADIVGNMLPILPQDSPLRWILGFVYDVMLDPLTYMGFGTLTKTGRIAKLAESAEALVGGKVLVTEAPELVGKAVGVVTKGVKGAQRGRYISASSKLGKTLLKFAKEGRLDELQKANTLIEAIDKGQWSLINVFGYSIIPKSWQKAIVQAAMDTGKRMKELESIEKFYNKTRNFLDFFNTKTGVKEIDKLFFLANKRIEKWRGYYLKKGVEISKRFRKLPVDQQEYVMRAMEAPLVEARTAYIREQLLTKRGFVRFLQREGLDVDDVIRNPEKYENVLEKYFPSSVEKLKRVPDYDMKFLETHLEEEGKQIVDELRGLFDRMWGEELKVGIDIDYLKGYFPHKLTPAAREMLNSYVGFYVAKFPALKTALKEAQRREFWMTLDELEAFLRKAGGGGEKLGELFIRDPGVLLALRGASSARAVEANRLVSELAQKWGKEFITTIEEREGWRAVEGLGEIVGKKYYFPDHIARRLEKMISLQKSDVELSKLARNWTKLTSWWKAWTLGVRPSFHARNMVTNFWNNWLAGVDTPESYVLAAKLQHIFWKEASEGRYLVDEMLDPFLDKEFVCKITGRRYKVREIMKAIEEKGVKSSGLFGADNPEDILDVVTGGTLLARTLGRRNQIVRAGFVVGRAFEDNARIAHFLHKVIKEGLDFDEASLSVAKYLFDYADLTRGEKFLRDIFFPFYTWSRKNIPLQVENLMKTPWKYTLIDKMKDNLERGRYIDYNAMSDYVYNSIPVMLQWDDEKKEAGYFLLDNWIGAADLQEIGRPLELVAQLLNPGIKIPLELATNYNFFFQTSIEKYPGQRKRLWNFSVPAKVYHIARTIGFVAEVDRLLDPERSLQEKIFRLGGMRLVREKPERILFKRLYEYRKGISFEIKKEEMKKRERGGR